MIESAPSLALLQSKRVCSSRPEGQEDSGIEGVSHLYAHIPFCPRKCAYCAFVTHVGSLKLLEPYVAAMKREASGLVQVRPGRPLQTVYFGGGTPSLLPPRAVADFLAFLDHLFGLAAGCEVSLEAHPETVDAEKLRHFRLAGVTRLSFGAESLNQMELHALGRDHTPLRVLEVIAEARDAGLRDINLDLMYGIPQQTLHSWLQTLEAVLGFRPEHLSLYPLSIEPRTVFARRWKQNALHVPDDEAVVAMYRLACDLLREAGYEHYEIANWALPGHRCRHNLAYWRNREFYAVGVGAHGYLKPYRTENIGQTRRYVDQIMGGQNVAREAEYIAPDTELFETIMLRLRLLVDGLELEEIRRRFQVDVLQHFGEGLQDLLARDFLRLDAGRLTLPEHAVPVTNEVLQQLLP